MGTTNHVGTKVPTAEEIQQLEQDIVSVRERLMAWGTILSSEDRGAFPKARPGFEKHAETVIGLAKEKNLSIDELSLDGLRNDLKIGSFGAKLEALLEPCRQVAADTRLVGQGEAWMAFLGYYGLLSAMAHRDPEVAKRLRPVVDFLTTNRRKPQEPKPE